MYTSIEELLSQAVERQVSLWRIVLENECRLSECTEEAVFARLEERFQVMEQSAARALESPLNAGTLIDGGASTQRAYAQTGGIMGEFLNLLMARALSCSEVNASMGRICAAPTAGACGILPAVLISLGEKYQLPRRQILEALLTASGIGAVITRNATVSGAEGGCQAECGVAAAMSAAAAVQMADGSPEAAVQACSLALCNCMGLVCDPVAGLVQLPCAQRNASQAVNALLSADLALAGMALPIPADQVVEAMYRTGQLLPIQLKETAMGGIAATPSAKKLAKELLVNK
ncbi:MAG: L-serine ammonia-lyase, iron-sulfur-dependent, subunit alpha [Oscillospiraceae bacterium]